MPPVKVSKALGGNTSDHPFGGNDFAAIGKLNSGGLAALLQDTGDGHVGFHDAAARLDGRNQRFDHRVGTALPDQHAKSLPGHTLKIWKHRATRDIRGKIKVNSPSAQQGLNIRVLKGFCQPLARRLQQKTCQI